LLPPPPPAVPPDLTRATARYKRHAWLAFLGLLGFVTVYVALTGWFCFTAFRLFYDLFRGGGDGFADFAGGALCGLLGAFLLSALFFLKHGGKDKDLEVTAQEEPALFAFLNALADRAGAQRPHRVFLSMRVNAAVFYDLSFFNLLFPSKKNLEIGLGLVNCLSLSEATAVLAHEFGHFAQRSMAVGRWVYMAQQIAGQIVASRSWLDKMLAALSRTDIRVAWIGWLVRLIVWSIRSLLDTVFGLVILAQRALGREMEFQADLVSVSLTGSDALVHALHRLGAADDAWGKALAIAGTEAARGRGVPDLFALQTRVIQRMGGILNDPEHGASPRVPVQGAAQFRVFEREMAEPPRMWSTHPPNRDREDNAKRVYVPAPLDPRPAFCLFANPDALRRKASARFLTELSDEKLGSMSDEAALAAVDKRFERPHLEQRYRGAYMGRSVVLHEKSIMKLYCDELPEAHLAPALQSLYPEQLSHELRELRQRQEERSNLEALRDGLLHAPGGVILHRGQVIQRHALKSVLAQVTTETEAMRSRVEAHDRLCRTSHVLAARALGRGWEPYLFALTALHHYAAHIEANLEDARGHLNNVFSVVTADGRVSGGERRRLVAACAEVHRALSEIFAHKDQVVLPPMVLMRLAEALGIEADGEPLPKTWAEVLPKNYALPAPTEANLADFFRVLDGWVRGTLAAVGTLERVSLELLVATEAHVSFAYLNRAYPGDAPPPPVVPPSYSTLARGQERSRQKRLGLWDRFQTADGFFPSVARFAVAVGILGSVLAFGGNIGHPSLTLVNGLGLPVTVEIQGHQLALSPGQHSELKLEQAEKAVLVARTAGGEVIETQSVTLSGSEHYVYNVAGATSLVEWTAVYGSSREVPDRHLGAPTFFTTRVDVLFEQPPKSVSTKSGGSTRTVLTAVTAASPYRVLELAKSSAERAHLMEVHALWDPPDAPHLSQWLMIAGKDQPGLLEKRLQRYPNDMSALRLQQDASSGPAKAELCRQAREKSLKAPSDPDLLYLSLRCSDDDTPPRVILEAYRSHPQHPYLANAAARQLLRQRDYASALTAFGVAAQAVPLQDSANLERARLLRMQGQDSSSRLDALARDSEPLALFLALERGRELDGDEVKGAARAYSMLAQGNLVGAVSAAQEDPEIRDNVLRLAAASGGASPALIKQALGLSKEAPSEASLWPSIALAEREHQSHPALDAQARKELPEYDKALLPFATDSFLKNRAAAEAALGQLSPEHQRHACVMALVRAAELAPAPCSKLATSALFASERPYFR
jgi:Zn-dependent protease with chaperone function